MPASLERRLALLEQRQVARVLWSTSELFDRPSFSVESSLTGATTGPVAVECATESALGFPPTLTCILHAPLSRLIGFPGARGGRSAWGGGGVVTRPDLTSRRPPPPQTI